MSTKEIKANGVITNRMNRLTPAKLTVIGGVLAGSAMMHEARAVWDIVPEVEMLVESNDNPRLSVDVATPPTESTRTMIDAQVDLSNVGQRGEIFFTPQVRVDAYAGDENEDLESEDLYSRSRGEYRWQMVNIGYGGFFSQESILSSELEDAVPLDPDLDDPIDTSSGDLDVVSEDRRRIIFAPYAEFGISERNSFRFESRFIDVSYTGDETRTSDRSDCADALFAAGIVRNLDEQNSVTARLRVSQFEAEANQNVTDTVAVEGTFSRPLSPLWSMDLGVGVQRSDYSFVDDDGELIDNADTNYAIDLTLRNRTERTTQNFTIRRTMNPNSLGFLVERNEFQYFVSRLMTQRVTGTIGIRLTESRTLDNVKADNDRDYARAQIGVEWAITQRWNLRGEYIYTFQEFSGQARDTDSNAFLVGISYRGLSRLGN